MTTFEPDFQGLMASKRYTVPLIYRTDSWKYHPEDASRLLTRIVGQISALFVGFGGLRATLTHAEGTREGARQIVPSGPRIRIRIK